VVYRALGRTLSDATFTLRLQAPPTFDGRRCCASSLCRSHISPTTTLHSYFPRVGQQLFPQFLHQTHPHTITRTGYAPTTAWFIPTQFPNACHTYALPEHSRAGPLCGTKTTTGRFFDRLPYHCATRRARTVASRSASTTGRTLARRTQHWVEQARYAAYTLTHHTATTAFCHTWHLRILPTCSFPTHHCRLTQLHTLPTPSSPLQC